MGTHRYYLIDSRKILKCHIRPASGLKQRNQCILYGCMTEDSNVTPIYSGSVFMVLVTVYLDMKRVRLCRPPCKGPTLLNGLLP